MQKDNKSNKNDWAFTKDQFNYTHNNPYHEKLADYADFVFRDDEAEKLAGKWNAEVFKRQAPLVAEIGSGYGHFMQYYCALNPGDNFIGMDYRFKRSFQLVQKLNKLNTTNFRYLRAKGERIGHLFQENELDKLYYFFPDPWPKARHHKKRLFQKAFLDQLHKVLASEGEMLIKTDHDGYFSWMLDVLQNEERFEITLKSWDLYKEAPEHFLASFQTKFEKIFLKQDIKIKALVLKKK